MTVIGNHRILCSNELFRIKFVTSRTNTFTNKELLEFKKAVAEDVSAGTVYALLDIL